MTTIKRIKRMVVFKTKRLEGKEVDGCHDLQELDETKSVFVFCGLTRLDFVHSKNARVVLEGIAYQPDRGSDGVHGT